MQSTMPTLHTRCAQAAHTHTQAAHTPHKVENLQQVQQIHQIQEIQKFQGILPRNLRRFQKCTAGQDCTHAAQCTERDLAGPAGPQFQKIQKSQNFTAANPDREDSAKQNSLTARSRNSFLWVEGVEVALPKGISRGSTRVLSASLRLA